MEWILRHSVSVGVTIFLASLLLTLTGFSSMLTLTESINVTDRAFAPKYLELKDGDMRGFGKEQLQILAITGFDEAKRLSEAYRKRGSDYLSYMELFVLIMFVQVVCLGGMFFVVYKAKGQLSEG